MTNHPRCFTAGKARLKSFFLSRSYSLPTPIIILLVVLLIPVCSLAADQTPRTFLQDIYRQYVGANTAGVKLDSAADYNRYFTPALAKIILADQEAAAKAGDVPTLDGDPFLDAQDWSIAKVQIDVDDKATDKAIAKVSFKNAGEAKTVTLDLVKLDEGWRIDDIHWPEDSLRGIFKH